MADSETPFAFGSAREDQFPINIYAFGSDQEFRWHVEVDMMVVTPIPGGGPGNVRYVLMVYADGTAEMVDDPSCGGTR